jgi:hypothetical protein
MKRFLVRIGSAIVLGLIFVVQTEGQERPTVPLPPPITNAEETGVIGSASDNVSGHYCKQGKCDNRAESGQGASKKYCQLVPISTKTLLPPSTIE